MSGARIDGTSLADLDALVPLWQDLVADQRRHGTHIAVERNADNARSWLATRMTFDGVRVAKREDSIVGFVSYELMRDQFERDGTDGVIQNLYVDPSYRDRGIGSRLLERAETILDDRGADRIRLQVLEPNERAAGFYRDRGYRSYRVMYRKTLETDTDNAADAER